MRAAFEHGPPTAPWRQPVARHPRSGETGSWAASVVAGAPRPSIKVRQQLPGWARYVVVVGRQEPAVRAPRAGLDTVPRPSVHMALAAGRARHRHNAIPAAGDADRDQLGDAVEGAQRGQGTAVAAAAVRCRSNVPASSIASVCSVSAQQSRLVGAVLAEQHDEWAEPRRHLDVDVLGKSRSDQHPPSEQEAHPAALTA